MKKITLLQVFVLPLACLALLTGAYFPDTSPIQADTTTKPENDYYCTELPAKQNDKRINVPAICYQWGLIWSYAGTYVTAGDDGDDLFNLDTFTTWQPAIGDSRVDQSANITVADWNNRITDLPTTGYSPWRLPTIKELIAIYERDRPSSNSTRFYRMLNYWIRKSKTADDFVVSSTAIDLDNDAANDQFQVYALRVNDGSVHRFEVRFDAVDSRVEYNYCGDVSTGLTINCDDDTKNVRAFLVKEV